MKAIQHHKTHNSVAPEWGEIKEPAMPRPEEVVIKVVAAGLNRGDLAQAAGFYPPPKGASEILGLEVSGTIVECGAQVTDWKSGDEVCALLAGGGYAEKTLCHEGSLLPKPKGWSLEETAALPEAFITAYSNLFIEAGLEKGESVLIHSGASGVGLAAIQLASLAKATIYATAGTDEKTAFCEIMGAAKAINYKQENWPGRLKDLTDHAGVDVILEAVGGTYLQDNIQAVKKGGRMINIGVMGGGRGELDMISLLLKNLTLKGTTLRGKPVNEKANLIAGFKEAFWPAIESGSIKPNINKVFPVQEVQQAHRYMAENRNIGKILLRLPED